MKKLEIIYEDEFLIAINKQAGVLSISDRYDIAKYNLKQALSAIYGQIFTIHRLDKNTSGVILFAKDAKSHRRLNQQFSNRETVKEYHAIVIGVIKQITDRIESNIILNPKIKSTYTIDPKGKESITDIELLEQFKDYALVKLLPLTGRTHQIRVHLKHYGHELLVDQKYSPNTAFLLSNIKRKINLSGIENPLISRSSLHAKKLTIKHPVHDRKLSLNAPYPKDFKATLNQLRKWNRFKN